MILVCLFSDGIFFLNFATNSHGTKIQRIPLSSVSGKFESRRLTVSEYQVYQVYHTSLSRGGSLFQEFQVFQETIPFRGLIAVFLNI